MDHISIDSSSSSSSSYATDTTLPPPSPHASSLVPSPITAEFFSAKSTQTGKTHIEFVSQIPAVSINSCWKTGNRRVFLSKSTREFRSQIEDACAGLGKVHGWIMVEIELCFTDFRPRDADNYQKSILDALKNILFEDDSFILRLITTKRIIDRPDYQWKIIVDAIEEDSIPIYINRSKATRLRTPPVKRSKVVKRIAARSKTVRHKPIFKYPGMFG
jgi:Holliday junction resolvase RusA-like endonuclease